MRLAEVHWVDDVFFCPDMVSRFGGLFTDMKREVLAEIRKAADGVHCIANKPVGSLALVSSCNYGVSFVPVVQMQMQAVTCRASIAGCSASRIESGIKCNKPDNAGLGSVPRWI